MKLVFSPTFFMNIAQKRDTIKRVSPCFILLHHIYKKVCLAADFLDRRAPGRFFYIVPRFFRRSSMAAPTPIRAMEQITII